eukprot:scaffold105576_cov15-Tisochrysis_lutea.AAC.1
MDILRELASYAPSPPDFLPLINLRQNLILFLGKFLDANISTSEFPSYSAAGHQRHVLEGIPMIPGICFQVAGITIAVGSFYCLHIFSFFLAENHWNTWSLVAPPAANIGLKGMKE